MMRDPSLRRECGFTLPELLAVIAAVLVILFGAMLFVHPKSHQAQQDNAQRWLGIAKLGQALQKYKADHGTLPAGLTSKPQLIGSAADEADLCSALVPAYVSDLPFDPTTSAKVLSSGSPAKNCAQKEVNYVTGYAISFASNKLTISAPAEELSENITSTQSF